MMGRRWRLASGVNLRGVPGRSTFKLRGSGEAESGGRRRIGSGWSRQRFVCRCRCCCTPAQSARPSQRCASPPSARVPRVHTQQQQIRAHTHFFCPLAPSANPRRPPPPRPAGTMRTDPRIRQSLNNLSSTLDSAADTARTGCFHVTSTYIEPCIGSLRACLPSRRHARRPSHRSEHSTYPFGFYNYDWDYDSEDDGGESASGAHGFLSWGTGELDRLLAGSGGSNGSGGGGDGARPQMQYGSGPALSRRSTIPTSPDPTVIPSTSMFGFLTKFGVRGKGMRYKPSAANLQEHPIRGGGRKRAGSGASADTGESFRSRRDLWPSEDEDDAVPIGDEALLLSGSDTSGALEIESGVTDEELRAEEERVAKEEEEDLERRRQAARRLAVKRGLSVESVIEEPEELAQTGEDRADNSNSTREVEVETEKGKSTAERTMTSPVSPLPTVSYSTTPSEALPPPIPPPPAPRLQLVPAPKSETEEDIPPPPPPGELPAVQPPVDQSDSPSRRPSLTTSTTNSERADEEQAEEDTEP